MKRPDCIRHWRDVEGADDATYPDSNERFSIGAPLARKLGLGRIGIHHERLPPGRRTSYPHAESEWVFLSRKGNPLSRQQFYHIISTSGGNAGLSLEIHPHMLRHSCGFALANMGIDTRLIQDYLGHRNIRHTVWYTASNAGRFYGIWDRARGRQRHAVL